MLQCLFLCKNNSLGRKNNKLMGLDMSSKLIDLNLSRNLGKRLFLNRTIILKLCVRLIIVT